MQGWEGWAFISPSICLHNQLARFVLSTIIRCISTRLLTHSSLLSVSLCNHLSALVGLLCRACSCPPATSHDIQNKHMTQACSGVSLSDLTGFFFCVPKKPLRISPHFVLTGTVSKQINRSVNASVVFIPLAVKTCFLFYMFMTINLKKHEYFLRIKNRPISIRNK